MFRKLVLVSAVFMVGCGGEAAGEDEAIQIVLDSAGDCLKAAGWDTDPAAIKEATTEAPADDTWRVALQSDSDENSFLRLAVNYKTREILAYKDDDRTKLAAAGCPV